MDYSALVHNVYYECLAQPLTGEVANYIPELAGVDPNQFGLCLYTLEGKAYSAGDVNTKFSIQSISKVFSLAMVYQKMDEKLWRRVGVEPSGGKFNSLALLEFEAGIPRNPFINAGALVIVDCLINEYPDPKAAYLDYIKRLANNPIQFNETVARSESDTGYRNAAHVALMKSFGNIQHDLFKVLDVYFHLCATEMTCIELARAFTIFANAGRHLDTKQNILSKRQTQRINALMQTCGLYDESGDYAFRVGLPGKSGVGGGVVAVFPGKFAAVAWSPPLNAKGNSARGIDAMERLTTQLGYSVF